MIVRCTGVFPSCHIPEILSLRRVEQKQPAAAIRICGGRASRAGTPEHITAGGAGAIHRRAWEVDSPIDISHYPQMCCLVAQVAGG